MLEISPAAVAIIDRDNGFVFANKKFSALFGYGEDELVGQSAQRVLPDTELCDRVSREPRGSAHPPVNHEPPTTNGTGKTKTGEELAVCYQIHEVLGLPEPLYLLHLLQPQRDQLDADHLEANRLAAIAQMVGGLAHESRNALQRAVSCLDLLELDLKNNPEHLQLSTQIRNSLCDLVDSYEEVRRYAQPIDLQRQPQSLLNLCQIAFNELAVEHDEFPHRLQIHAPDDQRDRLPVDRDRMRLVFRHLLENAIDASDGPARIEVDCQSVPSPQGPRLRIRVRDHGSGLPHQAFQRAFEPFFTTKQRGTGLGLAICQRILSAHDGSITLRCALDDGSPARSLDTDAQARTASPTGNGTFRNSRCGQGTCVELLLPANTEDGPQRFTS
ncbi:Sporulation kinase A [Roseimaritima ulvae]|uniref:histidine kinase n=2 Tax=Roseimaritima ulvae TaxID=980254 RepID=A0A5B9QL62_9BACT|nr:Sporulation kinase A [Roseimaritima ulvae]